MVVKVTASVSTALALYKVTAGVCFNNFYLQFFFRNWHRASLTIEDERRGKIPLTVSKNSITTIIYQ